MREITSTVVSVDHDVPFIQAPINDLQMYLTSLKAALWFTEPFSSATTPRTISSMNTEQLASIPTERILNAPKRELPFLETEQPRANDFFSGPQPWIIIAMPR